MGITQWIANLAVAIIAATSYPGILFLMMLESMVFPVPQRSRIAFCRVFNCRWSTYLFWSCGCGNTGKYNRLSNLLCNGLLWGKTLYQ